MRKTELKRCYLILAPSIIMSYFTYTDLIISLLDLGLVNPGSTLYNVGAYDPCCIYFTCKYRINLNFFNVFSVTSVFSLVIIMLFSYQAVTSNKYTITYSLNINKIGTVNMQSFTCYCALLGRILIRI